MNSSQHRVCVHTRIRICVCVLSMVELILPLIPSCSSLSTMDGCACVCERERVWRKRGCQQIPLIQQLATVWYTIQPKKRVLAEGREGRGEQRGSRQKSGADRDEARRHETNLEDEKDVRGAGEGRRKERGRQKETKPGGKRPLRRIFRT